METDKEILVRLFNGIKLPHTTTYKGIERTDIGMVALLANHPEYDDTFPENRKKIFKAYIEELRVAEKERARELRKSQLSKLKLLLATLDIQPSTTWKETQALYASAFEKDDDLKLMDGVDVLICFEDFIMTLDSQKRQERGVTARAARRTERKHRDAFIALLHELRKSGTVHIKCKWKDVYPGFKTDERYLAMLGTSGSSPLEMFWDVVMEMEDEYLPARRIVVDAARSARYDVNEDTSFGAFTSYFKREFRGLTVDHIKIAFDEVCIGLM